MGGLVKLTIYYINPHTNKPKQMEGSVYIPIDRIHKIYERRDGYSDLILVGETYQDKMIIDDKDFEKIIKAMGNYK